MARARRAPVRHTLTDDELAARGLAYRDAMGLHCSEGHEDLLVITGWANGIGERDSLDVLLAQLRAKHADVTPACLSAILNRRRSPGPFLMGAFERAFRIPAGAWTMAPRAARGQRGVDRNLSTGESEVAIVASTEATSSAAQ
jgi:hypothetical protein